MLRLIVLCGGRSEEREVSLRSGAAVAEALASDRRAGDRIVRTVDPAVVDLASYPFEPGTVCVNVLHGAFGEDGRLQRLLADRGVPVTGCEADASALTFSKSATRRRLRTAGLPIPDGETVAADAPLPASLAYPLVVKPDRSGSSVGLHLVRGPGEWSEAVTEAARHDRGDPEATDDDGRVVVEELLDGREWTVSVLGREPLPPIEVRSPRPLFDARAKYADDATSFLPINPERTDARQMQSLAVAAAEACRTQGLVRVDLRAPRRDETDLRVLEINTAPGMTERSLSPLAAMAAGMSLAELVDWMVRDVQRRARET